MKSLCAVMTFLLLYCQLRGVWLSSDDLAIRVPAKHGGSKGSVSMFTFNAEWLNVGKKKVLSDGLVCLNT